MYKGVSHLFSLVSLWILTGGKYPWDPRYVEENPDTSDGFDPTYIMQHATDSASTAGTLATGHKVRSKDSYTLNVALASDALGTNLTLLSMESPFLGWCKHDVC